MDITLKYPCMVLALLCGMPLPGAGQNTAGQTEGARRVEITAQRFDFSPGDITVKRGVPVTLVLSSKDVDHGLKFRDLNVVLSAKKGQRSEITFTPDKAGTFIGQCSHFCGAGHGSMKLTVHVTE